MPITIILAFVAYRDLFSKFLPKLAWPAAAVMGCGACECVVAGDLICVNNTICWRMCRAHRHRARALPDGRVLVGAGGAALFC